MIVFKVKNTDITVYISKERDKETYEMVSADSEGHEGLLGDNLTTIKEVFDLLDKYFGK